MARISPIAVSSAAAMAACIGPASCPLTKYGIQP
jgi:hypothetical protein